MSVGVLLNMAGYITTSIAVTTAVGLLFQTPLLAQPMEEVADVVRRPVVVAPEQSNDPPQAESASVPVPEPPQAMSYNLPFSLSDCYTLLSQARDALREQESGAAEWDLDSVNGLMETVSAYLRERDTMHSNLIEYEWEMLVSEPVKSGLPQSSAIGVNPGRAGHKINALSFQVDGGDVVLHKLDVYDEENMLVGPFKREVTLRHSLPRRYVFHLYLPTDVQRIVMSTSQSRPAAGHVPRVAILAGRTDEPEHGKAAIHYIWRSQLALSEGDLRRAERRLEKAQSEILDYRRFLNFQD